MNRLLRLTAILLLVCAALPAAAQHAFTWETGDRGAITPMSVIHTFHTDVINTGTQTDTYTVDFTAALPTNWFSSLCEGEFCYAPYPIVTQFTFELAPGDTNSIGVNMTPVTNEGAGLAQVSVTSQGNPGLSESYEFGVFSNGMDVLIVDADAGSDPGPLFGAALDGTGLVSGVWKKDGMGLLAAPDLANFATVLWAAGGDATPPDSADRGALRTYVEDGGHLYMSGADLARGLSDPPLIPQVAWMQVLLGAQYLSENPGAATVAGLTGDALGDGLSFAITGGDGAGNNGAPDVLNATGGGVAWAEYPGGDVAATRRILDQGRSVLTGFAFEGVASSTERTDLLAAVMEWLASSTPSAAGDPPAALLTLPVATPNPFNPRTVISFDLGGTRALDTIVDVHDLRGRRVRRLQAGPLSPGRQTLVWDGTDDRGRSLPSGVYLARVRAGERAATVKMTLAR